MSDDHQKRAATFPPGTKVRLKAIFLRNTGQYTGPDCHQTWIVVDCNCGCKDDYDYTYDNFELVAVNEERSDSYIAEMFGDQPDPKLFKWRHFNAANLIEAGKPDYS